MQQWSRPAGWLTNLVAWMLLFSGGCVTNPVRHAAADAQPEDNTIKIGERRTIHSTILNEDRPYLVHLPPSYHDKSFAPKRYPVMYVLDGGAHFEPASGVMHFMSANVNANIQIPELIVVAIPNTIRTRDLTPTHTTKGYSGKEEPTLASSGGGESFLRFLSEELIPRIEADYRTKPYRILVGHSFGGLFAMHAFLHRPQVFQAHIAIDPSLWWDNQLLLRQARSMLDKTNDFRGPVYLSAANNPASEDFRLADRLETWTDLPCDVRPVQSCYGHNASSQRSATRREYSASARAAIPSSCFRCMTK